MAAIYSNAYKPKFVRKMAGYNIERINNNMATMHECVATNTNKNSQNHFCMVVSKFKDCLTRNVNGRIKWLGDFENLKHFMAELYDAGGVWNSPGGSAKVFLYDQVKHTVHGIRTTTL